VARRCQDKPVVRFPLPATPGRSKCLSGGSRSADDGTQQIQLFITVPLIGATIVYVFTAARTVGFASRTFERTQDGEGKTTAGTANSGVRLQAGSCLQSQIPPSPLRRRETALQTLLAAVYSHFLCCQLREEITSNFVSQAQDSCLHCLAVSPVFSFASALGDHLCEIPQSASREDATSLGMARWCPFVCQSH
jgi:hypothetical protein